MTTFPQTFVRKGHGDLVATNEREAKQWADLGWTAVPNAPPTYSLFPMFLRGPNLPDLLVETEAQARAAADKGYRLPNDAQIEAAEKAFSAAYQNGIEEYVAQPYPKLLRHPEHRDAIPMRWSYHPGPAGAAQATAIPGSPEYLPDVTAHNAEEELEWTNRGWTIGSQFAQRAAGTREAPSPIETSPTIAMAIHEPPPANSTPVKRKLSGAARRRLARERTEHREMSQ
jgi:hypothetical protein